VSPLRTANTRGGTQRSQGLFVVIIIQRHSMDGRNSQLLDRCLKIVDPELFAYLRMKNLSAEIYAFPCLFFPVRVLWIPDERQFLAAVLTLCACTPPLDQVLMLWDFLLAFGVHLNVLCVIAQLLLIRDEVMSSPRFDLRRLRIPPRSCHPHQPHAPLANFSSARSCSGCWDSSHACTRSASRTLR
jgi:hypothetical protein